ncbi:MAG TPA: hypothetical protein VGL58_16215 [Caulobacteraceae bacterium]|jgi:hypothetical protein
MSVKQLQYLLASVFFVLGGWCVVAPVSVVDLCFRPEYRATAPIVPLIVACFGTQALISGLFAAFSRFTRLTFLAYGLALIPFFVGDVWFYAVQPMLTPLGLGDFAGNTVMLAVCVAGWRRGQARNSRRNSCDSAPEVTFCLTKEQKRNTEWGAADPWSVE